MYPRLVSLPPLAMHSFMSRNRSAREFCAMFRFRPRFTCVRGATTRANKKSGPVKASADAGNSTDNRLFASLRWSKRKKIDDDWIHGPETIIFHVPKLHVFHRLTAIFPAFIIFVGLYQIDSNWNHGLIENPQYDRFKPNPEQPKYIQKPLGKRLVFASITAGSCAVVVGLLTVLRSHVLRTISFRTDQPRHLVTESKTIARTLKAGQDRRMVSLTSVSGRRYSYPISELELGNAKRRETLLVKAVGKKLPFFFEVDDARIGWPGVTTMVEPFSRNLGDSEEVIKEKQAIHDRHGKQLFGLLWKTHSGIDLSRTKVTDPWATR